MKVQVKEIQDKEYPRLMRSEVGNKIVLFCDHMKGTDLKTGIYSEDWNTDAFTPINGSVTIQND